MDHCPRGHNVQLTSFGAPDAYTYATGTTVLKRERVVPVGSFRGQIPDRHSEKHAFEESYRYCVSLGRVRLGLKIVKRQERCVVTQTRMETHCLLVPGP